jgi:hypothetical protein
MVDRILIRIPDPAALAGWWMWVPSPRNDLPANFSDNSPWNQNVDLKVSGMKMCAGQHWRARLRRNSRPSHFRPKSQRRIDLSPQFSIA